MMKTWCNNTIIWTSIKQTRPDNSLCIAANMYYIDKNFQQVQHSWYWRLTRTIWHSHYSQLAARCRYIDVQFHLHAGINSNLYTTNACQHTSNMFYTTVRCNENFYDWSTTCWTFKLKCCTQHYHVWTLRTQQQ